MQQAMKADVCGLDTEFVWERTYFPRLGLIQLSLSNQECFLIDPLAISDLSPLGELLANPKVVKIFHDGSQDLAILYRATGAEPKNIFDTRLAAGFAGHPSILSLLVLVETILGVRLNKSQTRTNWLKRPLHEKQVKYGLDDVRYLPQVRQSILDGVRALVLPWLNEELSKLDDCQSYSGIADTMRYTKVKYAKGLDRTGLAILRACAAWREGEAQQRDKPRGHILADDILIQIAQKRMQDPSSLYDLQGISAKTASRYGTGLCEIVDDVLGADESTYPDLLRGKRLTQMAEARLRRLQGWIKQQGASLGVDPALIGNRAELQQYIQNNGQSLRQKEGWRKLFLAEFDS